MKKKREPVDELLDALVWMRRKAKKRQPVDDLIDALMGMRRKAKKKAAKRRRAVTASPSAAARTKRIKKSKPATPGKSATAASGRAPS
jgi:ClpP class serine protease